MSKIEELLKSIIEVQENDYEEEFYRDLTHFIDEFLYTAMKDPNIEANNLRHFIQYKNKRWNKSRNK